MARHNIVLGNDRAFTGATAGQAGGRADDRYAAGPQGYGAPQSDPYGGPQGYAAPQYGQRNQYGTQSPYGPSGQYGQQPPRDDLESIYARPAATGHDTGRMTMRDALNAITATLGIIVVVGGAVTLAPFALGVVAGDQGAQAGIAVGIGAMILGLIGSTVFALVNSFKRTPSAFCVLAYALFEGLMLGGLSSMFERIYPGIVVQAVLATLATAATVLVLFRVGVLRTSPRLTKIFMIAMVAYMLFCLVSIGASLIAGVDLRSGLLGLVIGAIAVVMASYSLVMDLEDVQRGVSNGVPRVYAWRCAFGLAATLVWMYVEILRILSIFRNN